MDIFQLENGPPELGFRAQGHYGIPAGLDVQIKELDKIVIEETSVLEQFKEMSRQVK